MRRKDREVTDKKEIAAIIDKCDVCRLALSDNNTPYIVPLNYGYEFDGNKLTLYFHSAKEGKKLDIIKNNPVACFEMDCLHRLVEGEHACEYTMEYESVIGNGIVEFINETNDKLYALYALMKKYSPGKQFVIPREQAEAVAVYKLVSEDYTGKRLLKS